MMIHKHISVNAVFLGLSAFFLISIGCTSVPFLSPIATPTYTSTYTPTITASPTLTKTTTPTLTPTPIFGSWRDVFIDPFDSNNNNWQSEPIEGQLGTIEFSFENGKYKWTVSTITNDGMFLPILAPTESLSDFYLSVDVEQTSGAEGETVGLAIRTVETGGYFFEVNQFKRTYTFISILAGEWQFPIYEAESSAIHSAGINTISVKVEGSSFSFFINNELVNHYTDATIPTGSVGILVSVTGFKDVVFEFDNFALYAS
jgi:hypothetical protein